MCVLNTFSDFVPCKVTCTSIFTRLNTCMIQVDIFALTTLLGYNNVISSKNVVLFQSEHLLSFYNSSYIVIRDSNAVITDVIH